MDLIDRHAYDFISTTGSFEKKNNSSEVCLDLTEDELARRNCLYRGSGGELTGYFDRVTSGGINAPTFLLSLLKLNNEKPPIVSIIKNLEKTFNLTITQLVKVCGVKTRASLYNWLDGKSKPRSLTVKRLFDLSVLETDWRQSGLVMNRADLEMPIINGVSVFDLLCEDPLDKNKILFAGSRIELEKYSRNAIIDPFL